MRHALLIAAACFAATLAQAQEPALVASGGTPTFGTTVVIPGGLRGDIYNLKINTYQLPNFDRLKPIGTVYTNQLFIPQRDFMEGFPGITKAIEWFAIDYKGKFWIDKPGNYAFRLTSDDGSKLYIDDRLIIDNDGLHSAQTEGGAAKLGFGIHSIRVSYYQGPGTELALVLEVSSPGTLWRVFNTNEFKPPPDPADWDALAALRADTPPNDFEFRVATLPFRNRPAGWQGALVLDVPAQTGRGPLSLLAVVKDSRERTVGSFHQEPPPEAAGRPFTYAQPLGLAPGHYTVEAAAVDRQSKRACARVLPLDVPPPQTGIGLSSVMLARLAEPAASSADDPLVYQGRHVVPLLASQLDPAQNPAVFFVVYPDTANPDPPKIRVEFLVEGKSLASQTAGLPPPSPLGDIPVLVGAAAMPGNCELRITAVQGDGSVTRSVRYTVAGK